MAGWPQAPPAARPTPAPREASGHHTGRRTVPGRRHGVARGPLEAARAEAQIGVARRLHGRQTPPRPGPTKHPAGQTEKSWEEARRGRTGPGFPCSRGPGGSARPGPRHPEHANPAAGGAEGQPVARALGWGPAPPRPADCPSAPLPPARASGRAPSRPARPLRPPRRAPPPPPPHLGLGSRGRAPSVPGGKSGARGGAGTRSSRVGPSREAQRHEATPLQASANGRPSCGRAVRHSAPGTTSPRVPRAGSRKQSGKAARVGL